MLNFLNFFAHKIWRPGGTDIYFIFKNGYYSRILKQSSLERWELPVRDSDSY